MTTTYDLIRAAYDLQADLMEAEGELTPEFDTRLSELLDAMPDKLGALRHVIQRMRTEEAHLAAEIKRLQGRKAATATARSRVASMATDLLRAHEELHGESRVRTSEYTAWLGSSTSLQAPEDPEAWPERWTETRRVVSKTVAKQALMAGEVAPGFELVTRRSVRFR